MLTVYRMDQLDKRDGTRAIVVLGSELPLVVGPYEPVPCYRWDEPNRACWFYYDELWNYVGSADSFREMCSTCGTVIIVNKE